MVVVTDDPAKLAPPFSFAALPLDKDLSFNHPMIPIWD